MSVFISFVEFGGYRLHSYLEYDRVLKFHLKHGRQTGHESFS